MSQPSRWSPKRSRRVSVSQQIWRILLIANVTVSVALIRSAPASGDEDTSYYRIAILLAQTATLILFAVNDPFVGRLSNWIPGGVTLLCWWSLGQMLLWNSTDSLSWAALLLSQTAVIVATKHWFDASGRRGKLSIETLFRWTTMVAIGFALFGIRNRADMFRFTKLDLQIAMVMAAVGAVLGMLAIAAEKLANSSSPMKAAGWAGAMVFGVVAGSYGCQALLEKLTLLIRTSDMLVLQSVYVVFVLMFCSLARRFP